MKHIWSKGVTFALVSFILAALCAGCAGNKGYAKMSMDEAAKLIESGSDYLLVDVRTQEEYEKGHIPGAILLPIEDIKEGKVDLLPDKDQAMMVYCWTGRRSEDSAVMLVDLGYTNISDIGGFIDWQGEVETGLDSN